MNVPGVTVPSTESGAVGAGGEHGGRMGSDEELLQRVVGGDRRALEVLYRRHSAWLAARLHARSPSPDLVEEALQDTFVAVWRGAGSYRGQGEVGAWIWGIAGRRLISLARKRRLPTVALDSAPEPPDLSAGPEDSALQSEDSELVRQAVARLPADQRAAITAVVFQGMSVGEAARAAAVAEGTVKSRLHRARARIAKELRR